MRIYNICIIIIPEAEEKENGIEATYGYHELDHSKTHESHHDGVKKLTRTQEGLFKNV